VDLHTADFDYHLPPELIAQNPADQREMSRLMVVDRSRSTIRHDRFANLGRYLSPGDVLVANRSKVLPARMRARKDTGGAVELLLLRRLGMGRWDALARPSRKLRPGMRLLIDGSRMTVLLERLGSDGEWTITLGGVPDTDAEIHRAGELPLPPYIQSSEAPAERYQTVYADREGSVAAPTAGLHFTESLIAGLRDSHIDIQFVTLHVGPGTFRPVTAERVEEHHMHAEWGEVPPAVASAVQETRDRDRRVVAVGTTSTRLLETAAASGRIEAFRGQTAHFIYPGYRFRAIDALITNFHLPRSTLLMLVSALAGRDLIFEAYAEAIRERYRFFSFGDAMLIL
jgi:S-adenosylmethionine:tRNA ribosyltransferase-isomerase